MINFQTWLPLISLLYLISFHAHDGMLKWRLFIKFRYDTVFMTLDKYFA